MKKPVARSFGSYRHDDGSVEVDVLKVAQALSKNWGDIPIHVSDRKAFEIFCLARGFLAMRKKLRDIERGAMP